MKGLYSYIVETEERYNNKVDVDGNELVVNTDISVDDHIFTNRIGTVLSKPTAFDTPVEEGMEVIVHHNVFRRWYDVEGNEKNSTSFLKDGQYIVNYDQLFGYKKEGQWYSMPGYCFVKPITPADSWETSTDGYLMGTMSYTPEGISSLRNRVVGYTPNSEYRFWIDGELLYRILSNHICIDYGLQETKRKNYQVI